MRCKHTLEQIKERLASGPNFQDFIQNPELSSEEWRDYEGKLKREKGESERLRLPPWLKTKIPTGMELKSTHSKLHYQLMIHNHIHFRGRFQSH